MPAAELDDAAAAALDCVGLRENEHVLVVCNAEQLPIAEALARAAEPRARHPGVLEYPAGSRHGEEPPEPVPAAMREADVVFAPTSFSISHTQARIEATRTGTRIATMPTITPEVFCRAVPVDYAALKAAGAAIAARLGSASVCEIAAAAGTDVRLSLEGRAGRNDDGDLREAHTFGNLPAGEGYIAPLETLGDGVIVFDGSLAGYGLLEEPLRVTLGSGRIVRAEGPAAGWLLETLDAGGEHGRAIAELGIGTNPAALLTGNILEDEKALGTIHLAFGTSVSIGGVNVSTVHIDGIVQRPTVTLDGAPLLVEGELR